MRRMVASTSLVVLLLTAIAQAQLASRVSVQDIAWSADGRKLFFSAMRVKPDYSDYAPDKWAVYRYDFKTKRTTRIAQSSFTVSASPVRKRIAVGKLVDQNRDIFILDENGREIARLTADPAEDFGASWSPDGRRIAFNSKRDGKPEVYVVDVDGKNLQRLTRGEFKSYNPSWSPDGRFIAFYLEKGDGQDQIYTMKPDGSASTNLTNDSMNNIFPGFTPDGRVVYGQGARNQPTYLFTVDPAAMRKAPLAGIRSFYGRYAPDGSRIAYVCEEGGCIAIVRPDGTAIERILLDGVK